jgi:1,5-anhydro-D-fructose reductase (1,5-anhydro-D-mannitol-forming)
VADFTPGSFTLEREGKLEKFEIADPQHVAQPLIQTIVDELLGKGKRPSTGLTAARASKVMDACLKTHYNGREGAFWARPMTWRSG